MSPALSFLLICKTNPLPTSGLFRKNDYHTEVLAGVESSLKRVIVSDIPRVGISPALIYRVCRHKKLIIVRHKKLKTFQED